MGDGNFGEDVSRNIQAFHRVPLALSKPYPDKIKIRGEIDIPKDDYERLNRGQEEQGFEPYANPRNLASGSVKLLDVKDVKRR
jgi:DNA ligase (NAD+)